jgi:hypothetical protein
VGDVLQYRCRRCGEYAVSLRAAAAIQTNYNDVLWKLSAYTREKSLQGSTPAIYLEESATGFDSRGGNVDLNTMLDAFPKTVAERLDRTLLNLARLTNYLGAEISLDRGHYPTLFASNHVEMVFIIDQLIDDGLVSGEKHKLPNHIVVTASGMNRVADLQRGLYGPHSRQVFVAMSFDKPLDDAWLHGLKLGIEDCGYEAMRVDLKQHNEKICDVIVAEIRKSKFIVADFTLHRNGVYFEAGLMMGLGRPVIFTCRKDELAKAHFDTRQYNHIEWETPADLRERLKRRIQATIAP